MKRLIPFFAVCSLALGVVVGTGTVNAHSKAQSKGSIIFGKDYKNGSIEHQTSNIPKNKPFAWLARFNGKAGKKAVTVLLINTKGPGPHGPGTQPSFAMVQKVSKSATSAHAGLSTKQIKKDKIKPAGYTLEYEVGTKIIASGDVSILSCSNCSGGGGGY